MITATQQATGQRCTELQADFDAMGRQVMLSHGHARRGKQSPEYTAWRNMKRRCTEPNHPQWADYGGRGIEVCRRWLDSFENFLADAGPRPSPSHSLDRFPDNNGNYEPGNVRWATKHEQCANTRRNVLLSYRGKTQCLRAWARELGIAEKTLAWRIHKSGMTLAEAAETPIGLKMNWRRAR